MPQKPLKINKGAARSILSRVKRGRIVWWVRERGLRCLSSIFRGSSNWLASRWPTVSGNSSCKNMIRCPRNRSRHHQLHRRNKTSCFSRQGLAERTDTSGKPALVAYRTFWMATREPGGRWLRTRWARSTGPSLSMTGRLGSSSWGGRRKSIVWWASIPGPARSRSRWDGARRASILQTPMSIRLLRNSNLSRSDPIPVIHSKRGGREMEGVMGRSFLIQCTTVWLHRAGARSSKMASPWRISHLSSTSSTSTCCTSNPASNRVTSAPQSLFPRHCSARPRITTTWSKLTATSKISMMLRALFRQITSIGARRTPRCPRLTSSKSSMIPSPKSARMTRSSFLMHIWGIMRAARSLFRRANLRAEAGSFRLRFWRIA